MKFKFLPALLFFLSGFVQPAFCQITTAPGFIVRSSGDTVRGQLEFVNTNLPGRRAFIPEASGRLEFLTTDALKAYCIYPEIHFKTLPVKGKKVYMQVISEGKLNLYQYKNDLFIGGKADSLVKLTGGNKTVDQNGKKYAIVDYSYKSQIRQALPGDTYNREIDRLPFERDAIGRFAQDINQMPVITPKIGASKRNQFGVQAGVARNTFRLKKNNYHLNGVHSETSLFEDDFHFKKKQVQSLNAGAYYRRKVGKRQAYLKAGVFFEKSFDLNETETKQLYRSILVTNTGSEPFDQAGFLTDRYTYKFTALSFPLSYTGEFTAGRLRPFIDAGLNFRFFVQREMNLRREVYIDGTRISDEKTALYTKRFAAGPMLGAGCRYLLRNNTAVAAGLNFDLAVSESLALPDESRTNATLLYVSYGF